MPTIGPLAEIESAIPVQLSNQLELQRAVVEL